MKKWLLIMINVFLVSGLVACAKKDVISETKAKEIVLKDAGVESDATTVTFSKLLLDQEDDEYELSFNDNATEYEYTIDAYTGKIKEKQSEIMPQVQTETLDDESKKYLQLALEHFGLQESEVVNSKVEIDSENNVKVYEVSFYKNNVEYICEYNAADGSLMKAETDQD